MLFNDTIRYNIAYGNLADADDASIAEAAKRAEQLRQKAAVEAAAKKKAPQQQQAASGRRRGPLPLFLAQLLVAAFYAGLVAAVTKYEKASGCCCMSGGRVCLRAQAGSAGCTGGVARARTARCADPAPPPHTQESKAAAEAVGKVVAQLYAAAEKVVSKK